MIPAYYICVKYGICKKLIPGQECRLKVKEKVCCIIMLVAKIFRTFLIKAIIANKRDILKNSIRF